MSFSADTTKTQNNTAPTTNVPNTGGFSFDPTGAGDAGKQMSTGLPSVTTITQNKTGGLFGSSLSSPSQATGFNFATTSSTSTPALGTIFRSPATTAQPSPVTFGASSIPLPATTAAGIPNPAISTGFAIPASTTIASFSLNTSTITTTIPSASFPFGTSKPTSGTGFSLGGGESIQAPVSGIHFGAPPVATAPTTGFGINTAVTTAAAAPTATTTGFTFGGAPAATSIAPGFSQDVAKTSSIQTGLTFATPPTPAGFGIANAAVTTSARFPLTTGTTTSTFTFGTATTTPSTVGFMLSKTTTVTTSSNLAAVTTHTTLATTTTVSSSASAAQPGSINFCQLEESINKWTLELEEQEKVFVNQATQINAWDKLLITNGEKIMTLNQEVERVKLEQQQLEHELDYVVGQQKELQDCLVPLEKELASLSVSDPEREYTYRLAENIDTQLKQMSEDLKEIIEHLNEANRIQDSNDPIVQIGKILNAHMNSLQWLDQRTTLLNQKIQQIDQMHQNFRQENERSFNLAYN